MKIAIFENEYESVKGAFEAANLINFNNQLDIKVFPSSQKANLNKIDEFIVIFVDIDLSSKSELDGFSLIQQIQSIDVNLLQRVVILTGNNKIQEALKNRNIDYKIKTIIKPTNYEEISQNISQIVLD